MLKKLFGALALTLFICNVPAVAQKSLVDDHIDSLAASTHVVNIDGGAKIQANEVRDRILTFYYDQFRNSQDPAAPYFLFMSKEKDLLMGIGGKVAFRGWYDWGGAMPTTAFLPFTIPIPANPTDMRHFDTTPAGTALFFRVLGHSDTFGEYQAYIEANFKGYESRGFHLKKAYVMWRDFTLGYAATTFSDEMAQVPMVDAGGPANKGDRTQVLFRYMPRVSKHVLVAASVETPSVSMAVDGVHTAQCSNYLPDAAAFVQYDWGHQNSQHVRLSGIVRSLPYRNLVAGTNHTKAGWGVQLSSVSHPARPLTLYVNASYGAGYAGMGGDIAVGNYDLIADPEAPGTMYAPRSMGWSLGLQYNLSHNLFVCLMGSQSRFLPSKGIDPREYKYGWLGAFTVYYNPIPRVTVGGEFDFGKRQNFSRQHRYARRINLTASVSF